MFTSIDKAIVALLGALVYLIAEFTSLAHGFIGEELIQPVAIVLTAILVYLVPNKRKDEQDEQ